MTFITSVRLKLYEILNNDDLWDKARVLYACCIYDGNKIILSFFTSYYNIDYIELVEKDNINDAYEYYELGLLIYVQNKQEKDGIKQFINKYKRNSEPIWTENLTSIQFNR